MQSLEDQVMCSLELTPPIGQAGTEFEVTVCAHVTVLAPSGSDSVFATGFLFKGEA